MEGSRIPLTPQRSGLLGIKSHQPELGTKNANCDAARSSRINRASRGLRRPALSIHDLVAKYSHRFAKKQRSETAASDPARFRSALIRIATAAVWYAGLPN
jgi:hypothetical protein